MECTVATIAQEDLKDLVFPEEVSGLIEGVNSPSMKNLRPDRTPGLERLSLGSGNLLREGVALDRTPGLGRLSRGVGNLLREGVALNRTPGLGRLSLGVGNLLRGGVALDRTTTAWRKGPCGEATLALGGR